MGCRLNLVGVVVALAALTGCSRDADPLSRKGISTDTPQAVGAAWIAAMDEGDFETVVACMAPETVRKYATWTAWEGLQRRDQLEDRWAKDKEKRLDWEEWERRRQQHAERVDPVLLEHGLTKKTSAELKVHLTRQDARQALAKKIRDPAGFYAGYLEATRKKVPVWKAEGWPPPRIDEVAIDGNHAKGKLIYRSNRVDKGDKLVEFTKPLDFVRLPDGNWRIEEDYKSFGMFFDEKPAPALQERADLDKKDK
jgi:hypothetical protein